MNCFNYTSNNLFYGVIAYSEALTMAEIAFSTGYYKVVLWNLIMAGIIGKLLSLIGFLRQTCAISLCGHLRAQSKMVRSFFRP